MLAAGKHRNTETQKVCKTHRANKQHLACECEISFCSVHSDSIWTAYLARHSPWFVLHTGNAEGVVRYKDASRTLARHTAMQNIWHLPGCSYPVRISLPSCKQQCFVVFTRVLVPVKDSATAVLRCSGGRVDGAGAADNERDSGLWDLFESLVREDECWYESRCVILRWAP